MEGGGLRALVLLEDPGSVPSIHTVTWTIQNSTSKESSDFWLPQAPGTHCTYIYADKHSDAQNKSKEEHNCFNRQELKFKTRTHRQAGGIWSIQAHWVFSGEALKSSSSEWMLLSLVRGQGWDSNNYVVKWIDTIKAVALNKPVYKVTCFGEYHWTWERTSVSG